MEKLALAVQKHQSEGRHSLGSKTMRTQFLDGQIEALLHFPINLTAAMLNPLVINVHGLGSSKDSHTKLTRSLVRKSEFIAVSPDMRAHGGSIGVDLDTVKNVDDLLNIIGDLSKRLPFIRETGVLIIANSYGCYVTLQAYVRYLEEQKFLREDPEIKQAPHASYLSVPFLPPVIIQPPLDLVGKYRNQLLKIDKLENGSMLSRVQAEMEAWVCAKTVRFERDKDLEAKAKTYERQARENEIRCHNRKLQKGRKEREKEWRAAYRRGLDELLAQTRNTYNLYTYQLFHQIFLRALEKRRATPKGAEIEPAMPESFESDSVVRILGTLRIGHPLKTIRDMLQQTLESLVARVRALDGGLGAVIIGSRDKTCEMGEWVTYKVREKGKMKKRRRWKLNLKTIRRYEGMFSDLGDNLRFPPIGHNPKNDARQRKRIERVLAECLSRIKAETGARLASKRAHDNQERATTQTIEKTEAGRGLLAGAPLTEMPLRTAWFNTTPALDANAAPGEEEIAVIAKTLIELRIALPANAGDGGIQKEKEAKVAQIQSVSPDPPQNTQ